MVTQIVPSNWQAKREGKRQVVKEIENLESQGYSAEDIIDYIKKLYGEPIVDKIC